MSKIIQTRWAYGTEYTRMEDILNKKQIISNEYWPASKLWVTYNIDVNNIKNANGNLEFELLYDSAKQNDKNVLNPDNEVEMGISRVAIDLNTGIGHLVWTSDSNVKYDDFVPMKIIEPNTAFNKTRATTSVIVKLRPKQAELRETLFYFDRRCVLTGETEPAALDAAHIVPVKNGGNEVVENALLLRADIHRLFDAGLFWFKVNKNHAIIKFSPALSDEYKKLLEFNAKKLTGETFTRVKAALEKRSELPGGNGFGNLV